MTFRFLLPSLLALGLLGGCARPAQKPTTETPTAAGPTAPVATFTNPLLPAGADPWVIYRGGYYYYTQTTGNNLTL